MHILWRAYVTADPPEKVVAHYAQAEGRERGTQGLLTVRRGDKVLTVHSIAAKDCPDCGQAPRREDQTIVIVSRAIRAR